MNPFARSLQRWIDPLVAVALATAYTLWLLCTVHDLGYARDEGFYFHAADTYAKWFQLLFADPLNAIQQANVDRYWTVNREHPALIKSLFAGSRWLFHDALGWFEEPGTSYRFVGMVMTSSAVALIYLWGRRAFAEYGAATSRAGAVVAAASFALMPRIFYHAHLDCFDMPVVAMWLLVSYVYWRSLDGSRAWAIAAGVCYGLMLNTKHNSWLLPFALVGHLLYWRGFELWSALRLDGFRRALGRLPPALFWMAGLGPLLLWLTWPWIWFDTFDRLREYVVFHTRHDYYNMEFLGRTYFEPPFPRAYAPLMTISTVPAVTLALATLGILCFARGAWRALRQRQIGAESSTQALWLCCIVISYAPWISNQSPIFGGAKHWTPAYPFLALFAGFAFVRVCQLAHESLPRLRFAAVEIALGVSVLVAPFVITADSHPWGLSTYTPIVGGSPGAATLGLNRSFWGYTTGAVQDQINEHAKRGDKVFIHDTAMASWNMLAKDGRVRRDLKPQLGVANSKLAIYHHEQHMSRVEHQIWVDYGTVRPFHVAGPDGVPVVWLYYRGGLEQTPSPRRK